VRRALALAAAVVARAACTQEARPDGVVENWLRSLNQGAAGRPDRYAPDVVSQQVVPGWHDLDPGQLDVIEVGAPTTTATGQDVPFRLVDVDGAQTFAIAHLAANGNSWRIASVDAGAPASGFETAAAERERLIPGWPLAVIAAVVSSLAAVGVLTLVRRSADRAR
jgi:hypothetical protein